MNGSGNRNNSMAFNLQNQRQTNPPQSNMQGKRLYGGV